MVRTSELVSGPNEDTLTLSDKVLALNAEECSERAREPDSKVDVNTFVECSELGTSELISRFATEDRVMLGNSSDEEIMLLVMWLGELVCVVEPHFADEAESTIVTSRLENENSPKEDTSELPEVLAAQGTVLVDASPTSKLVTEEYDDSGAGFVRVNDDISRLEEETPKDAESENVSKLVSEENVWLGNPGVEVNSARKSLSEASSVVEARSDTSSNPETCSSQLDTISDASEDCGSSPSDAWLEEVWTRAEDVPAEWLTSGDTAVFDVINPVFVEDPLSIDEAR